MEFPALPVFAGVSVNFLCMVRPSTTTGISTSPMSPEKPPPEAMVIVNKILCRTPLSVDDLLDGMINWPDNADPTAWYYVDVQEATNGHEYEWLDKEQTHEHWTQLDNKEEKQSFLIRLLHLFRGKG